MDENLNEKLYNFYQTFIADTEISSFQKAAINEVLIAKPKSVLDFGCNVGNVMQYLYEQPDAPSYIQGMDFGKDAVRIAQTSKLNVWYGDDVSLQVVRDNEFDVVYTCSVLSHIINIDDIIEHFKRIASKRIVLAETQERKGEFYFPHDYQKYGFKLVDVVKNKYQVEYEIWVLDK